MKVSRLVAVTKENKLITLVTANCPAEIELIENCQQQTNSIDFRINVLKWMRPRIVALFESNVQVLNQDGSIHKTTTIQLKENVQTEIKQMVKDERIQKRLMIFVLKLRIHHFLVSLLISLYLPMLYPRKNLFLSLCHRSSGRC